MIRDMSNREYHSHPAISSSDVKMVAAKSLAHWKSKVYKPNPAFAMGSAIHALVLEPEKELVMRGPEDRRGNKWKEAQLSADLDDKILLTESDYDLAEVIANAVREHEVVKRYLENPTMVAEASIFAKDPVTGVDIKCRPDGYLQNAGIVFDVKTTRDASPDGFPREIRTYGYDLQAAFYLRCMKAAGLDARDFVFVAVEKEAPYAIGLHTLTDEYLFNANDRVTMTLEKIAAAEATETYTTGWPLINYVSLPRWMSTEPEDDVFTDVIDF